MIRPRRCKAPGNAALQIRQPLVLLPGLVLLLAFDATGVARLGLLCALLHEGGHVLAYRRLMGRWPPLELSPLGIRLRLRWLLPAGQELLLAAAGPLTNLLLCVAAFLAMEYGLGYSYRGYWFASANLLVGGANLLPLPGLDGARILACLYESAKARLAGNPNRRTNQNDDK